MKKEIRNAAHEENIINVFLSDPVTRQRCEIVSPIYQSVGGFNNYDIRNPVDGSVYTVTFKIKQRLNN